MDFAEGGQHHGAETQGAGPARVIPGGGIGLDLRPVGRQTEIGQDRLGVGLGIKGIDAARLRRPMARAGLADADAGGDQLLVFRLGAGELGADLEQG